MTFSEFFCRYNHVLRNFISTFLCPRVICNDGFSFSAQAGPNHYSMPKAFVKNDEYTAFEIACLSDVEEMFMQYADDPDEPLTSTYYYVDLNNIEAVVANHGGVCEQYAKLIDNFLTNNNVSVIDSKDMGNIHKQAHSLIGK